MLLKAHISPPVLASEAVTTGQTLISQIGGEFGATRLWRGSIQCAPPCFNQGELAPPPEQQSFILVRFKSLKVFGGSRTSD